MTADTVVDPAKLQVPSISLNVVAGTSRQCEQVSIAAARKPEKKELKVKNGVERTEMLFRQVSDFIE